MTSAKHIILLCLVVLASHLPAQLLDYPTDTIKGKVVYKYRVEKSIGLWRISQNFGCSQEEIIALNPALKTRGLKYDEIIFVPVKQQAVVAAEVKQPAKEEVVAQPAKEVITQVVSTVENIPTQEVIMTPEPQTVIMAQSVEAAVETSPYNDGQAIKIALLLPLHAKQIKRNPTIDRFYDFYTGSLLAVKEMQDKGQAIELHVYDTEKSESKILQLTSGDELTHMDAIIGPAYHAQVDIIANWSLQHQIPTIVPFLSTSLPGMHSNPYLLQFNMTDSLEAKMMARHFTHHKDSIVCILIDAKEEDIPHSIQTLQSQIQQHDIPTKRTTIRTILNDSLSAVLSDSLENIIIFNTERFSNLKPLMPYLLSASQGHRLTLYSHYSWQNEAIALPQIYATTFKTDSITDHPDYNTAFDYYFHHQRASERPYYDVLGYDITRCVIRALQQGRSGQLPSEDRWTVPYNGLQSNIHYERVNETGGYCNTQIHIIRR